MISALTHELERGWQAKQNLRQYLFLTSVFLCESSMVALNSRRWEVHRVLEMLWGWRTVGPLGAGEAWGGVGGRDGSYCWEGKVWIFNPEEFLFFPGLEAQVGIANGAFLGTTQYVHPLHMEHNHSIYFSDQSPITRTWPQRVCWRGDWQVCAHDSNLHRQVFLPKQHSRKQMSENKITFKPLVYVTPAPKQTQSEGGAI